MLKTMNGTKRNRYGTLKSPESNLKEERLTPVRVNTSI